MVNRLVLNNETDVVVGVPCEVGLRIFIRTSPEEAEERHMESLMGQNFKKKYSEF